MFDIGFFELLLIGIVGLLVLGPERLPRAARTAGLWVGRIKRSVSTMQREITSQLEAEELRQKLAEQQKKLDENVNQARRGVEKHFEIDKKEDSGAPPSTAGDATPVDESTRAGEPAPSAPADASPAPPSSSPADKDSASR
ncbi:MAG: twin-arginine translocase subunit TatB [Salinicola sp.]|uniref:Sec-independent protein translocase protein TatB n=1 Tax=Salinicola sp. TaxID=1978524 RepID=UPI000C8CDA5A|nr:Sec-independent protein translocase protein TatB [Salinicola sp.]MAM56794.1 twin-arginine translocase subunit TatB [Salinicola sp.]NRB57298.1 twin-arginine translocase subunit TatB [Salinicola sp.]